MEMDNGLKYALVALSFFRGRHRKKPLYKKSKRRDPQTVSCYHGDVYMARRYIKKAREHGFSGSIMARVAQSASR